MGRRGACHWQRPAAAAVRITATVTVGATGSGQGRFIMMIQVITAVGLASASMLSRGRTRPPRPPCHGVFLESTIQDPCPTLNGTRVAMPQILTRLGRREPVPWQGACAGPYARAIIIGHPRLAGSLPVRCRGMSPLTTGPAGRPGRARTPGLLSQWPGGPWRGGCASPGPASAAG
jgi:hypothetical protein